MLQFARACEAVAFTSAKTEKLRLLATYLRSLDDADLEAASRFFTGNPFAQREPKSLSLGASTIVSAARNVWDVADADLSREYRQHGDLGAALCSFIRAPADLGLFAENLSPASLQILFREIAGVSGRQAGRRRSRLCERILASCKEAVEAKYVIKIMTGDLRIGLREGLVLEAIAFAFDVPPQDVRRASMASGDIGSVAVAARHHSLQESKLRTARRSHSCSLRRSSMEHRIKSFTTAIG